MEQRLEKLHQEVVADLKTDSNVFSSKWYRRHIYPNRLFRFTNLDHPAIKIYEGGLGMGHYVEVTHDGNMYRFIGLAGSVETVIHQSADWDDMKKKIDTFFTGLLGVSDSNTNGGPSDGTGRSNQGSGRGGTYETQGGVAGCGCTYGTPCSGRRQVHPPKAESGYGSYFRAGSPVPERTVASGPS